MTLFVLGMIGGHISAALLAWVLWTMMMYYGKYRWGANWASIQRDFYILGRIIVRVASFGDRPTRLESLGIMFMCGMVVQTGIILWVAKIV